MSPVSNITFQEWQAQQSQDPEFVAESLEVEAGHQIALLRLLRGLTQAELADRLGTRQASIARLKNGSSMPNLPFLERIAEALDAQVEIKITTNVLQP